MRSPSASSMEQLLRQREWLKEPWSWLMRTKVLPDYVDAKPTALDVGCGPGLLMELFSPTMEVQGLDSDPVWVETCRNRRQKATLGIAEELPFGPNSFDIVYCSYLLLWVVDPVRVLNEMRRVSRKWVICLAEPDYGGRVSYPPEVRSMDDHFARGMRRLRADPEMGRKLQGAFSAAGLRAEMGVHPGMWNVDRMRSEAGDEWYSLATVAGEVVNNAALADLKKSWDRAAREGSLVQYTPTFYALARKD